jgi:hypothetical protein
MARAKRWRKQAWQSGEESIRRWGVGGGRGSRQAVQAVQVGGGLVEVFGGDIGSLCDGSGGCVGR